MNGRERVAAMLAGIPTDHLPFLAITMQFAADRIGARYLDYETDYRVLVEGQLRVAEEFGLDYVNTMSDPACEAADCGAAVAFDERTPAAIDERRPLLNSTAALARLRCPDPHAPGRMQNRLKALELFQERIGGERLIEGWIEGPCAEAADLRGLMPLMLDFYDEPAFVRDLFEFILKMELRFARAQVEAGAEQIGIGDAAASLVGPQIYEEFVWPFEKRMVDAIHQLEVPVRLHICGDTRAILEPIGRLGCDIVDLDYFTPIVEARRAMGANQILLGNIDPVRVLRNQTPREIVEAIAACHREAGANYIVGAGCEAPRDTPEANFRAMAEYARNATAHIYQRPLAPNCVSA